MKSRILTLVLAASILTMGACKKSVRSKTPTPTNLTSNVQATTTPTEVISTTEVVNPVAETVVATGASPVTAILEGVLKTHKSELELLNQRSDELNAELLKQKSAVDAKKVEVEALEREEREGRELVVSAAMVADEQELKKAATRDVLKLQGIMKNLEGAKEELSALEVPFNATSAELSVLRAQIDKKNEEIDQVQKAIGESLAKKDNSSQP